VLLTKHAIDQADAIRDLSIRIGTSTETLSAYGYAATQTGTDIESLGRGLKILAKNVAAGLDSTSAQAGLFKQLGITVTDAGGQLKNMSELIPEIADKFKSLEDGTTKAALA
jgi:TP901 family phage tail tape measure protein